MSSVDPTPQGVTTAAGITLPKIVIIGVHNCSDAYPNVKYRVLGLLNSEGISAQEYRYTFLWRPFSRRGRSTWRRLVTIVSAPLNAILSHLRAVAACVLHARSESMYVPYPAPLVLFCLSFFPRVLRPRKIIADAFISLYDTVVSDRTLLSDRGLPARLLHWIEQRAYRLSDLVVADTAMNAAYLTQLFRLPASKVVTLPLAIGEQVYSCTSYHARAGQCTVLFIGTFVPLQGAEVIARAVSLLRDEADVQFRIIGYGQSARSAREILENEACRNYVWMEEWQDATALAGEICRADICLGIFGTTDKTQRVWPLKNYGYMACGRPIITGDTACARELTRNADPAPFAMVPVGDPQALAAAIRSLAHDGAARIGYAHRARGFYEQNLAGVISIDAILKELLR